MIVLLYKHTIKWVLGPGSWYLISSEFILISLCTVRHLCFSFFCDGNMVRIEENTGSGFNSNLVSSFKLNLKNCGNIKK